MDPYAIIRAFGSMPEARRIAALAQLPQAEREEIARLVDAWVIDSEAHPLAHARLWHRTGMDMTPSDDYPDGRPRTSQRRALNKCVGSVLTAVLGGNGTGKTEGVSQLSVAAALGRDHPDTREWLRVNKLDPELVPPYPGRVLVSALTGNDSKRVVRRKVDKYLPVGAVWRNKNGDGEAYCYPLGGQTRDGGGVIVFKSNDQGPDKHQSDEYDIIIGDEEHDEPVVEEWLGRLGRRPWKGGYIVLSMTPLKGLTWVYRDCVDARTRKEGYGYDELHGPDNPYADQAGRRRWFGSLTASRRAAREFGKFAALVGRVYDMFDRRTHVIPPMLPPVEWTRYQGWDWGGRAPHVLWAAQDPGGRLIVYRELAPRRGVTETPIRTTELIEDAMRIEAEAGDAFGAYWYRVADSEDPGAIMEAAARGLMLDAASKGPGSVDRGIEMVQAQIALMNGYTGEPQEPQILITEDCPVLISEMDGMRWRPQRVGQPLQVDPTCADHGPDALRYIVMLRAELGV